MTATETEKNDGEEEAALPSRKLATHARTAPVGTENGLPEGGVFGVAGEGKPTGNVTGVVRNERQIKEGSCSEKDQADDFLGKAILWLA